MGTRLYIGNLSPMTTEDELRGVFSEDGRQVTDVKVVTDRATGQSRGFAFVELATESSAKQAIEALNGRQMQGTPMRVKEAKERAPGTGNGRS